MKKTKFSPVLALLAVVVGASVGGGLPVYVKIGLESIPPFTYTFFVFF